MARKGSAKDEAEPVAVAERQPLEDYAEKAYLRYALHVILDRALPHIGDGLKPVQRRVVYAMSELSLRANAKHKKSARTVGDVIGKFHPHGETAVYEAMALLAQPFTSHYPLIDGQGNWGSADDPKSFAAMRYTEARLTQYAERWLLSELHADAVDWAPNFDGTMQEPVTLPAQLPLLLLNGASGIAVGMAADIPPHNLAELLSACRLALDKPHSSVEELCALMPGPDCATGAEIITPREELVEMYRSGQGKYRMRARWEIEGSDIVVKDLPWHTSPSDVMAQIGQQMEAGRLPMVVDVRDESDDDEPTRLVISPRGQQCSIEELMSHLCATTMLERSYRANFNVIGLDDRPAVKPLPELLREWLHFRATTVRRQLAHRLAWIHRRLHLLAGLLAVYLHLDEVIAIIRRADEPKAELMRRFALDDEQAEAILEIKLRRLAKLEEGKLATERDALEPERDTLQKTLDSPKRLKTLMRQALDEIIEEHGRPRRAPLAQRDAATAFERRSATPTDPITVTLSQHGWLTASAGHDVDADALDYKTNDAENSSVRTRQDRSVMALDDGGRVYTVACRNISSGRGKRWEPLQSLVKAPSGARFVGLLQSAPQQLLASSAGYGLLTASEVLQSRNPAGKNALHAPAGAEALAPTALDGERDCIAILSGAARLLVFAATDMSVSASGQGKGNKLIALPKSAAGEPALRALAALGPEDSLVVHTAGRRAVLAPKDWQLYRGKRGQVGRALARGFQSAHRLTVRRKTATQSSAAPEPAQDGASSAAKKADDKGPGKGRKRRRQSERSSAAPEPAQDGASNAAKKADDNGPGKGRKRRRQGERPSAVPEPAQDDAASATKKADDSGPGKDQERRRQSEQPSAAPEPAQDGASSAAKKADDSGADKDQERHRQGDLTP